MPRLIALLLALLLAPTGSVDAQTRGQSDDVIVFEPTPELRIFRSKHYRIFTTLSKDETRPYGRHMDALYEQYERRFRSFSKKQVEPMPLYLFRSEQQYSRFLAEHDIDATHSGGMFFVTHKLEGLATWTQARSPRRTIEVLQHEGFHQFAWHVIGPTLPVWLNEGLAQYFENAVIRDGKMSLGITRGARIEMMRRAIKAGKAIPLSKIGGVSNKQWTQALRRDRDHSSMLYAQAWSVTYFLIHAENGKHKPALLDYLKRLSRGERSDDAMLMAFGKGGLGSFDKGWRAYALQQKTDNVAEATDRLEFLGTGLRLLVEQEEAMPEDLAELRKTLQRYGFRLRRQEMGVTRNLSADRAELFRYQLEDGGSREFVLIEPEEAGLPPSITAPSLDPQPVLTWHRDADGKLVQDIAYR